MPDSRGAPTVRVALVAEDAAREQGLRRLLEGAGIEVVVETSVDGFQADEVRARDADVLLVNLSRSTGLSVEQLEALVENAPVPILFNEGGGPAGSAWAQRLMGKLNALVRAARAEGATPRHGPAPGAPAPAAPPAEPETPEDPARIVVLGASLGGPQALKQFLGHLPADLPVCFILAQHIGESFLSLFVEQLDRVTPLRVAQARAGMRPAPGLVLVVPVEGRFELDPGGAIGFGPTPERRPFNPCIDEVMTAVAARFGARAQAIVFSGMGSDGAEGVRRIAERGGAVWAQDAASCVISGMPDAARRTGVVRTSASPARLAEKLTREVQGDAPASGAV